jgi:hypothetical protein
MFQKITPNTPVPTPEMMEASRKLGVNQKLFFNVYKKAKSLWDKSPAQYQIQSERLKSDPAAQVLTDIEHLSAWKKSPLYQARSSLNWTQSTKLALREIMLPVLTQAYPESIKLPKWADHRKVAILNGVDLKIEGEPPLDEPMRLLYLSNGQHNAVPQSLTFTPDERKRIRKQWNKVLHQQTWRSAFNNLQEWMDSTGVESISIQSDPNTLYKWVESQLLRDPKARQARLISAPTESLQALHKALPGIANELLGLGIPHLRKKDLNVEQALQAIEHAIYYSQGENVLLHLHSQMPGNTVLTNDEVCNKNEQRNHAEECGLQVSAYSTQEILTRFTAALEQDYPTHPAIHDLNEYAEQGKVPNKRTLSRDLIERALEQFRQMPIPAHVPVKLKAFAHSFPTVCKDPISSLMQDNTYLPLWTAHHDRPFEPSAPKEQVQMSKKM